MRVKSLRGLGVGCEMGFACGVESGPVGEQRKGRDMDVRLRVGRGGGYRSQCSFPEPWSPGPCLLGPECGLLADSEEGESAPD